MKSLIVIMILTAMLVPGEVSSTQAPDLIIIAHQDVRDGSLNTSDIKNIFLGKKSTWSDGTKISFAVLADGDLHKKFLARWVKRSQSQYTMYWRRMVFTGRARSLKVFDTESELLKFVATTEGAVAYIGTDLELTDVKSILIEGE